MNTPNNISPGMPRDAYDQVERLNISLLLKGQRTLAHLKYAREHPAKPSDAQRLGLALHEALLEPGTYKEHVGVLPEDYDGRRGDHKKVRAEMEAQFKLVLKHDESLAVAAMRESALACPTARELLECPGKGEVSIFWTDADSKVECKGRVDRFCTWRGFTVVLDVKTMPDVSLSEFRWHTLRYNDHVKAAWYLDGLNAIAHAPRRFIWLAIESEPPYLCALYEPPDTTSGMVRPDVSLAAGRAVYRTLLDRYAEAERTNVWPGYADGIEPLGGE